MDASPLARLPRELRDLIYEYIFTTPYAVTLSIGLIEHPLTRTCRQLRHETLELYYSLTSFNAHLDDGPSTPLADWFKRLGPERVLSLREVNVWDLHMLRATLYGKATTTNRLITGSSKAGLLMLNNHLEIRPGGAIEELQPVVDALNELGLELWRFWVVGDMGGMSARISEYAIVRK